MSNRVAYGLALSQLGEYNPKVIVLDADLAKATYTIKFAEKYPDRFLILVLQSKTWYLLLLVWRLWSLSLL